MFQLEPYAPPIPVFLQCQLALQVTSPHVLFLLLHRQPGTPYRYIFALWRNSLPLSVNLSHISSSLLLLSSHPAPFVIRFWRYINLFVCMYVCMGQIPRSTERISSFIKRREGFFDLQYCLHRVLERVLLLECAIVKSHLSVCLSVRHTRDPRLNGSRYRLNREIFLVCCRRISLS